MEDMEFFGQEPALPFGEEFMLSLSPLGDECYTEQTDGQGEQDEERVSSPSLYSNFVGFPTKIDETLSDDHAKEMLTEQILGLINQPFVTVNINDEPVHSHAPAKFQLTLSQPNIPQPPQPQTSYTLTSLSSSPIDSTGSELLELVSGFNADEELDAGPLADPNLLFDLGPLPAVLPDTDTTAPLVPDESSLIGDLPALLDSFQPDDVDNIGQDEIDSILSSYPSSPTEASGEQATTEEHVGSEGGQPALAGFVEQEEVKSPRKKKVARVARSTRSRRPKPYDDFVLEDEGSRPIGRPSDPTLLVPDRKARKKDQNRDAALRYRQKKKKEMDSVFGDAQRLEEDNRELKDRVEELTHDIDLLRNILREKYMKEGKQLPAALKSK